MNESEFEQKVDQVLADIEQQLDDAGVDFDYETVAGILTLTFDDQSKIILNRQTALRQIWLATRAGGFHYDYVADSDEWIRQEDQSELLASLSRHISEQSDETIELSAA